MNAVAYKVTMLVLRAQGTPPPSQQRPPVPASALAQSGSPLLSLHQGGMPPRSAAAFQSPFQSNLRPPAQQDVAAMQQRELIRQQMQLRQVCRLTTICYCANPFRTGSISRWPLHAHNFEQHATLLGLDALV